MSTRLTKTDKDFENYPMHYLLRQLAPDTSPMFTAISNMTDPTDILAFYEEYICWLKEYGETKDVRDKATEIARSNMGYAAGYYDEEIRKRIYDTLGDCHPIFGRC